MRTAIAVDQRLLTQSLQEVEKNGPLANRSLLWDAMAEWYNKRAVSPITFSIVALRVKAWGLTPKTPVGKRGRGALSDADKASMQAARGQRKPRSAKMGAFAHTFELLRKQFSKRIPLVVSCEKGSLKASIKAKCLDCTCDQPIEVKNCTVEGCALYPHRPFQGKASLSEEGSDEG